MMKSIFGTTALDRILQVVQENAEWFFEDADEIGSSDISCCVSTILGDLCNDANINNYHPAEVEMIRNAVHNSICNI